MGKGSGSGRGSGGYYLRGGHAPTPASSYASTLRQHHSEKYGADSSTRSQKDGGSSSRRRSSASGAAVHGRPKGLLNVGNSCYANAALQCLFSTALTHALLDPKASAIFRRYSSNPHILEQGSGSVDSHDVGHHQTRSEEDEEDNILFGAAGSSSGNAAADKERRAERKTLREKRRRERDDRRMRENCTWLTRELKTITLEYQDPGTHASSSSSLSTGRSSTQSSATAILSGWLSSATGASETVVVDPGTITKHPDRLSKCLHPYQQEDAHEFLRALLSTLVMNGQNKQLSSLFDGLLESAVTCLHCRRPSLTRDRYMDLSLDICGGHVETLTDALEEFTKTETLSGDNKVYCAKCEMKCPATKGLRLATAPSILACHLKRFAFDSYGRLIRLSKRVKFPLRLEIGDYMSRVNKARPPPYELVAVLVHQGQTCDSGHYLAYVKNGGLWYKCNDSQVEVVDVATVLKQQAYILLYEVEEMRSKHGYSSPGGSPSSSPRNRPSSSTFCRGDDSNWAPYLNGWRDYLSSTSLCGMDDSLLREFCWDAETGSVANTKGGRRRRNGSTSGASTGGGSGSAGHRSGSTGTTTTRRIRRSGRDYASNRSIDSCSHHDAHDDLSTLGESTVESSDTAGKIPFRRISSSGNLNTLERYRGPGSSGYHSTGRPRQHFFGTTSDQDAVPDYFRSTKPSSWAGAPSSGRTANTVDVSRGRADTMDGARGARSRKQELPPRPEAGTATTPSAKDRPPPTPHPQHRRSSSVGVPSSRGGSGSADQQHYNAY